MATCDKGSRRAMRFRPCIDLHEGKVKQIVGSTLSATGETTAELETNFETTRSSADFAATYMKDGLPGGHIIMLGPGCQDAAMQALGAYPQGMQVGGGVTAETAAGYITAGASHVIVTSYVFKDGKINWERLEELVKAVGKEKIVLDLSCRRLADATTNGGDMHYYVVTDKWQKYTDFTICKENLERLSQYCDEFLVHGVDVEGKQSGILTDLVELLAEGSPLLVTYAGGARNMADLDLVKEKGQGRVDLTIGSALDIFGGKLPYSDVVAWQRRQEKDSVDADLKASSEESKK